MTTYVYIFRILFHPQMGEREFTHLANAEICMMKNEINKLCSECGEVRLHIDAKTDSTEFVELVLNHGAHIDIVQPKPLHTSIVYRHKNTAAYLILQKRRLNIDAIAVFAFGMDRLDFVNKAKEKCLVLLKKAADDTNNIQSYYRTCFNYACARGDTEVAKLLLHCGLEVGVDFTDFYYTGALGAAARKGQDTIEFLVKLGSDINDKLKLMGGKCSPLDYAKERLDFLRFTHGNPQYNLAGDKMYLIFQHDEEPSMREAKRKIKMEVECWFHRNIGPFAKSQLKDVFVHQFQLECYAELRLMKLKKLKKIDLTFYDIMRKSYRAMAKLMRNENVLETYRSGDFVSEFPIYATLLAKQFRIGLYRRRLHEKTHRVLIFLFKNLPELPIECIEKILDNFCVKELWRVDFLGHKLECPTEPGL